jgi:hypothetical protein
MNERTCISCKHFDFDSGMPDMSDLTPGTSWSLTCRMRHYYLSGTFAPSQEEFRMTLEKAQKCPDFEDYRK